MVIFGLIIIFHLFYPCNCLTIVNKNIVYCINTSCIWRSWKLLTSFRVGRCIIVFPWISLLAILIQLFHSGKTLLFVPKPKQEFPNSWRRSTSVEEKQQVDLLDGNNECRRKTIQIVKAICKGEPTLKALTSFHLKTIMFHIVDPNQIPEIRSLSWSQSNCSERVLDFLGFMQQYLEAKKLPQYFIQSMDIFQTSCFSEIQLANMEFRIKNLRRSQVKFLEAISC